MKNNQLNSIGSSRLLKKFKPFNLKVKFKKIKKRQSFSRPTIHTSFQ